jgi:hypothetical protein
MNTGQQGGDEHFGIHLAGPVGRGIDAAVRRVEEAGGQLLDRGEHAPSRQRGASRRVRGSRAPGCGNLSTCPRRTFDAIASTTVVVPLGSHTPSGSGARRAHRSSFREDGDRRRRPAV